MALQLYKIASIDVGSSGATTMEFASIPQGYTDLKLVFSGRDNASAVNHNIQMIFNNSSTGYSNRVAYSDGSTSGSGTGASSTWMQGTFLSAATSTANTFSSIEIYIPNYTGSSYKTVSFDSATENNSTSSGGVSIWAGFWANTSAISSIKFTSIDSATTSQYTTATLYGIL